VPGPAILGVPTSTHLSLSLLYLYLSATIPSLPSLTFSISSLQPYPSSRSLTSYQSAITVTYVSPCTSPSTTNYNSPSPVTYYKPSSLLSSPPSTLQLQRPVPSRHPDLAFLLSMDFRFSICAARWSSPVGNACARLMLPRTGTRRRMT
jgi:hypothetical protein